MSTKTWVKSLVAAVCVGVSFGLYARVTNPDVPSGGAIVDVYGAQIEANNAIVVGGGYAVPAATSIGSQDKVYTATVRIKSASCFTYDDVVKGDKVKYAVTAGGTFASSANGRSLLTLVQRGSENIGNYCSLACNYNEADQLYYFDITAKFSIPELRAAYLKGEKLHVLRFAADWDMTDVNPGRDYVYEDYYDVLIDPATVKLFANGVVQWDVSKEIGLEQVIASDVNFKADDETSATVTGVVRTTVAQTLQYVVDTNVWTWAQCDSLKNAYYVIEDSTGALVETNNMANVLNSTGRNTDDNLEAFNVGGAIALRFKRPVDADDIRTELINGRKYAYTFKFDLNGDGVYNDTFTITYDPKSVAGKDIDVGGHATAQTCVDDHNGTKDNLGLTYTYAGKGPFIQYSTRTNESGKLTYEYWFADITITAPDWARNNSAPAIELDGVAYKTGAGDELLKAYPRYGRNPSGFTTNETTRADRNANRTMIPGEWLDENGYPRNLVQSYGQFDISNVVTATWNRSRVARWNRAIRNGSEYFTYGEFTGDYSFSWKPVVTVTELRYLEEGGKIERTLKVDWNNDGICETEYKVVFDKSMYLYKENQYESPTGYFYPIDSAKDEEKLIDADGSFEKCKIVNGAVSLDGYNERAMDDSKIGDGKAWNYTFKIYAPTYFQPGSMLKNLITVFDKQTGAVIPADWVWDDKYGRYVAQIKMFLTPKMLDEGNPERNILVSWDGDLAHATEYSITGNAETITLKYEDGTKAWPINFNIDSYAIKNCKKDTLNSGAEIKEKKIYLTKDGNSFLYTNLVWFGTDVVAQNTNFVNVAYTNLLTGWSSDFSQADLALRKGDTKYSYTDSNFTMTRGLARSLIMRNALTNETQKYTFELFGQTAEEEFTFCWPTMKFFYNDGKKFWPLSLNDWAFENRAIWIWGDEIHAGTGFSKIEPQAGAEGAINETLVYDTGDWNVCTMLVKAPADISTNNAAFAAFFDVVNGQTNLVASVTNDSSFVYYLPVSFNFGEYAKAFHADKKIVKSYLIKWSPFYDAVPYTVTLDVAGMTIVDKSGNPIDLGKSGDAVYKLNKDESSKGAVQNGNTIKIDGPIMAFYDDIANDLYFTWTLKGASSFIDETKDFWNVEADGLADPVMIEGSKLYGWTKRESATLADVRAGNVIEKTYKFDWNFDGKFADSETYTVTIDTTQVTLTNKYGDVVFPYPTNLVSTISPWNDANSKKLTVGQADGGTNVVFSGTIKKAVLDWQRQGDNVNPPSNALYIGADPADKNGAYWLCATIKKPTYTKDQSAALWNDRQIIAFSTARNYSAKKLADCYYTGKLDGCDVDSVLLFAAVNKEDIEAAVLDGNEYFTFTYGIAWNGVPADMSFYTISVKLDKTLKLDGSEWSTRKVRFFDNPGRDSQELTDLAQTITVFDDVDLDPLDNVDDVKRFDGWSWYKATNPNRGWINNITNLCPRADNRIWNETGKSDVRPAYNNEIRLYAQWTPYTIEMNGVDSVEGLPDAFHQAVLDGGISNIKLLKNETLDTRVPAQTNEYEVVLDLNGKTLTLNKGIVTAEGAKLTITNGAATTATLVVNATQEVLGKLDIVGDVNVVCAAADAFAVAGEMTVADTVKMTGDSANFIKASGKVTLNGAIESSAEFANGEFPTVIVADEGAEIVVNADIACEGGLPIYVNGGDCVVNAGAIKGLSSVYVHDGKVTVPADTKAEFIALAKASEWSADFCAEGKVQVTGDAIFADGGDVEVLSGKYTTTDGQAVEVYNINAKGTEVFATSGLYKFYTSTPFPVRKALFENKAWEIKESDGQEFYEFVAIEFQLQYVLNDNAEQPATAILTDSYTVESTGLLQGYEEKDGKIVPVEKGGKVSREGWFFEGWFLDEGLTREAKTFADVVAELRATDYAQVKVYAKWVEEVYTVTFKKGAAITEVILPDPIVYKVTDAKTDLPVVTAKGYEFIGWFTAEDEQITAVPQDKIDAQDYELTAKWRVKTYTIKYVDGYTNPNEQLVFTVENPAEFDVAERDGYDFLRWDVRDNEGYTASDVKTTAALDFDAMAEGQIEVVAIWVNKATGEKAAEGMGAIVGNPEVSFAPAAQIKYAGYVIKDGAMVGSVSFTAAKQTTKATSRVNATFKLAGRASFTKSTTLNATAEGPAMWNTGDGDIGTIAIANEGVEGVDYGVFACEAANKNTIGAFAKQKYTAAYAVEGAGDISLRISIAATGKATVNGVLVNGAAFSATCDTIPSKDGSLLVPVFYNTTGSSGKTFASLIRIAADGAITEESTSFASVSEKGIATAYEIALRGNSVVTGAKLAAGKAVTLAFLGIEYAGSVAKSGISVTFEKKDNIKPTLSYTASTGAFSGSVKVAPDGGKAVSGSIKGVMISATEGYGLVSYTVSGVKYSAAVTVTVAE